MQAQPLLPQVKWAQRKDRVFLTVEIRDIQNEKVDLQATSLKFDGNSDQHAYEFSLNFFDEVNVEESKWNILGFAILFILVKKDADKPYWKRLTKEEKKFQYIQVDWTKYIDEDDEAEEHSKGLNNDWDQDKFKDFQGGQGQGEDEDDEGGLDNANLDDLDKDEDDQHDHEGHDHEGHDHGHEHQHQQQPVQQEDKSTEPQA